MARAKVFYSCSNCGYQTPQWIGQCPNCGSWNSLVEDVSIQSGFAKARHASTRNKRSVPLVNLSTLMSNAPDRVGSNISEFDRVLGGGFVPGQVVLIAGEPGVGKSTLLTQIAKEMCQKKVLYVCGEESAEQVKLRTSRMKYKGENLYVLPETDVDQIVSAVEHTKDLSLAIVDSIQTLTMQDLAGLSGSITQVRGCAQLLTDAAKRLGVPIVLVGHVTKEGMIAGPKVLEHIVDTVLYLEGDTQHLYRILRTTKNRFGPVSEIGVFELDDSGLKEVKNPSQAFLSETSEPVPGSCITVVMEGYRPILFEVQALAVPTNFGYPKRTTSGFSANRLQVLIAILEKRCGLRLSSHDVFLNIAGGFKVGEYAADLAVCVAIASALKDKSVKPKTIAFGECGLGGEVRKVSHMAKRISEAKKLGYTEIISPESCRSIKKALERLSLL